MTWTRRTAFAWNVSSTIFEDELQLVLTELAQLLGAVDLSGELRRVGCVGRAHNLRCKGSSLFPPTLLCLYQTLKP